MNKYEHSVIDVCIRLNGDLRGSGDPLPDLEAQELVPWLRWRITAGWSPPAVQNCAAFDSTVRELAREALLAWDRKHGLPAPSEPYTDTETALADLLFHDEVFPAPLDDTVGTVGIYLNCSDTFGWATADAEPVPYDEILPLHRAWQSGPFGTTQWVCLARCRRPMPELEARMREAGAWSDELEKLP